MAETEFPQRAGRGGANGSVNGNGAGTIVPAESTALRLTPERDRALDVAVAGIEKQFGKGAIMRLGEGGGKLAVGFIPTGSIALDLALGIGGLPPRKEENPPETSRTNVR